MLEIYQKVLEKSFQEACASIYLHQSFAIGFFFMLLGADKLLQKTLYNFRLKLDQDSTW